VYRALVRQYIAPIFSIVPIAAIRRLGADRTCRRSHWSL